MHTLPFQLILASKSPRRHYLLKQAGFDFEVHTMDVEEDFPAELKREQIPLYLSNKKADAFQPVLKENEVVITADTIVWINDHVLNKPENEQEAIVMLKELSGSMHQVYTGVSLRSVHKKTSFFVESKVFFRLLTEEEIVYYVKEYKPLDKAGAYGIQEWIGYIGIERIEGSYYNIMGLPVMELYQALHQFSL